ncbi:MAG: amidohydrolase family protein [Actinomycetota bacterium]
MSDGLPAGTCDTHMHVYDQRYPTSAEAVVLAPDAPADAYAGVAASLGIDRVVVVQPSAYGLDNRCQLAAMSSLANAGLEIRGVMVVDGTTPVAEIERLDALGVRGARFHMLPGGAVGWEHLEPVAELIAPFGWHVQLQLDGNDLPCHLDRLAALPCDLVVDHVGRYMAAPGSRALRRRRGRSCAAPPRRAGSNVGQAVSAVRVVARRRAPLRRRHLSGRPPRRHPCRPDAVGDQLAAPGAGEPALAPRPAATASTLGARR